MKNIGFKNGEELRQIRERKEIYKGLSEEGYRRKREEGKWENIDYRGKKGK